MCCTQNPSNTIQSGLPELRERDAVSKGSEVEESQDDNGDGQNSEHRSSCCRSTLYRCQPCGQALPMKRHGVTNGRCRAHRALSTGYTAGRVPRVYRTPSLDRPIE